MKGRGATGDFSNSGVVGVAFYDESIYTLSFNANVNENQLIAYK